MKHRSLAVLLLLSCICGQIGTGTLLASGNQDNAPVGQQAPAGKKPTLFRELWQDEKDIWTSPFRMKGRQFVVAGAILAATALIYTQDERIAENIINYHDRHNWVHVASKNYTQLGGLGAWAIAGGFLAGGLLAGDPKAKDTGLMALEAMAHTSLLTGFSKYAFGRQRPFVEDGRDRWLGIWGMAKYIGTSRANDYTSFFSGHTAAAFSLATVISEQYRNHGWVPWVCYTLAGVEGLTRTVEYKHWFSDVVIGAVVGIGIGKLVVRNHRKRRMLTPVIMSGRGGASVGFLF